MLADVLKVTDQNVTTKKGVSWDNFQTISVNNLHPHFDPETC
jgi:hypothetical protein